MIAVYGKNFNPTNAAYAQKLFDCFAKHNLKVVVEEKFLQVLTQTCGVKVETQTFTDFKPSKRMLNLFSAWVETARYWSV